MFFILVRRVIAAFHAACLVRLWRTAAPLGATAPFFSVFPAGLRGEATKKQNSVIDKNTYVAIIPLLPDLFSI